MGDRLLDIFNEVGDEYRPALQELLVGYLDGAEFNERAIYNWFYFLNLIIVMQQNAWDDGIDNMITRLQNELHLHNRLGDAAGWANYFDEYCRNLRMVHVPRNMPGNRDIARSANRDSFIYGEQVRQRRSQPGAIHVVDREPRYVQARDDYGQLTYRIHHDRPRDVTAVASDDMTLPAALPFSYTPALAPIHSNVLLGSGYLPEDVLRNISSFLPAENVGQSIEDRPARYVQSAYGEPVYGPHLPAQMRQVENDDGEDGLPIYAINQHGVRYPPHRFRRSRVQRSVRRGRELFFGRIGRR